MYVNNAGVVNRSATTAGFIIPEKHMNYFQNVQYLVLTVLSIIRDFKQFHQVT